MPSSRLTTILFCLLSLFILAIFYLSVRLNTPPSYEKLASLRRAESRQANTSGETTSTAETKPTITLSDPSLGPVKAPITIIEYSDFRCAQCALAELELKKILQTYPAQVRLVWKDFPFFPPLNVTWQAHEAARCAERQNQFWAYHDLILSNPEGLNQEKLLSFARELKLDETVFSQCLISGIAKPLVSRGFEEGKAVGVDGTPFFFVNGEKWTGEMTVERIADVIARSEATKQSR